MRLAVTLYQSRIGWLVQDGRGNFDFKLDEAVLERYGLASTVMSIAVPLLIKANPKHTLRRRNFFAELLPEGSLREYLAQAAQKDRNDVFGLLSHYGLDLAGALEIYPEDCETQTAQTPKPYSKPIDDTYVRYLLENIPLFPLANEGRTGKTSLGGMQLKIVLEHTNKKGWAQVHNGQPSTHILKPPSPDYPTLTFDEAWGLDVARACGLIMYGSEVKDFDGLPTLVIQRYDRDPVVPGARIHQEDFNQVLGASGSQKYQEMGGRVSLARIVEVLKQFSTAESHIDLAKQVLFSVAIGNLDMHAKNISILHYPDERIALAPAYDLVPLQHQNTDGRLALGIGGEYVLKNLSLTRIIKEFMSWDAPAFNNAADTRLFSVDFLKQVGTIVDAVSPHQLAHAQLATQVSRNISRLIDGKRIGS